MSARAQELCESRGGRPVLPSLINLRFLWTQSNTSTIERSQRFSVWVKERERETETETETDRQTEIALSG